MNFKFTLLNFLLLFTFAAGAQSVTGIWQGYFVQNTFGYYEDRYKFEVQIDQAANNALKGVTYSYKTTVFYGKATLQGIYTEKTNNIVINETGLVELKMEGESQACLMTCYLEYSKMGNLETLTGTYTSRQVKGKGDCGSGKVYLERTTESDFYKEDFLLKKDGEKKKPEVVTKPAIKPRSLTVNKKSGTPTKKPLNGVAKNKLPNKVQNPVLSKKPPVVKKPPVTLAPTISSAKPKIKPGAEDAVTITKRPPAKTTTNTPPAKVEVLKPREETPIVTEEKPKVPEKIMLPKPEVLKQRGNELVKTIYTSAHEIKIQLYDNGEIDGDTISVYHNNELIVSRRMLSDKPITFTIKADDSDVRHEFVMVAENLGTIPPNTASMVITAGSKRYDLFISSTEQKNAMVVIEYKPEN